LARCLRLFAYGFLSVVLVFYLTGVGIGERRTGLLLSLTLVGDTLISLWLTTRADRAGRRLTLVVGAMLMAAAGVVFALTGNFALLLAAGIIGVISPSGKEVGPFLSVEQAAFSHVVPADRRAGVFAWTNLAGSWSGALGVLVAGWVSAGFQHFKASPVSGYRAMVVAYGMVGLALAGLFARMGRDVEWTPSDGPAPSAPRFGLGAASRPVVFRLAGLFVIDAFAGGFVMDGLTIFWFHARFGVGLGLLGWVYFATNMVAGFSGLWAAKLSKRFGLINTMVFTHLPSNVLLVLVPLMPNLPLAAAVLLLRFCISQMDVPTRQAYTMAIVRPDERSAAAGVTGTARTIGAALAPVLAMQLYSRPALAGVPFFIAGGLKIVYDGLLYRAFVSHHVVDDRPA
jgi:MFS family permease